MSDSERDRQILGLADRYALVTLTAVARTLFAGLTEKAAERVITRLLQEERLQSLPLVGRRCYYTLTTSAAQELGRDPARFALPLGGQALLQNWAMMAFCLLGVPVQRRLTLAEFAAKFPSLAHQGIVNGSHRTRYYLDTSDLQQGHVRLALMVPDLGAHPRRLLRKLRRQVEHRREVNPQLQRMINERQFSVTLLTAFPEKARQMEQALRKEQFHSRVIVLPGFSALLPSVKRVRHEH